MSKTVDGWIDGGFQLEIQYIFHNSLIVCLSIIQSRIINVHGNEYQISMIDVRQ